jgi:hypothetical protein
MFVGQPSTDILLTVFVRINLLDGDFSASYF